MLIFFSKYDPLETLWKILLILLDSLATLHNPLANVAHAKRETTTESRLGSQGQGWCRFLPKKVKKVN